MVEAGVVPLIVSVLGGFLHEAEKRKHRSEVLDREARRLRAAAHGVLGPVGANAQPRPAPATGAAQATVAPTTIGGIVSRLEIPSDDAPFRSVSPAVSLASTEPPTPSNRSLAGVSGVSTNIFAWPPATSELSRQALGEGPSASSSTTSSWASMEMDEGQVRTPEEEGGSGSGDADEDEVMDIVDDEDEDETGERRSSSRRDRAIRRRTTIKPTVVVEPARPASEPEAMDINDDDVVTVTPRTDESRLQAAIEATPVPTPLPATTTPNPAPEQPPAPAPMTTATTARSTEVQRTAPAAAMAQLCYREEDVVLSLQLLAYLSKYAHVRDVFHEPADRKTLELTYGTNAEAARAVASFAGKVRHDRGEREKEKEKLEKGKARKGPVACPIEALVGRCRSGKSAGSTFSSVSGLSAAGGAGRSGGGGGPTPTTNAAGEVVTINPLSTNVFSFVERFTHQPSTHDRHATQFSKPVLYWAGVVMRNACRKDESRGGIRRCANMQCGKWEAFPREFAKCRRCRKAKYCSKGCQSKAWQLGHRFWSVLLLSKGGEAD